MIKIISILFLISFLSFETSLSEERVPIPDWEILGHYAEACNCDLGCPCLYKSPPTHGNCNAALAFSLVKGNFGVLSLSGLNVSIVGEIAKGGFISFYIDEKASKEQKDALSLIFRSIFGRISKHDMGVKSVPIKFDIIGEIRKVMISGILNFEVEKVKGMDGESPIKIFNAPAHFIPELIVAKSKVDEFKDHGKSWKYSERSGFHGEFFFSSFMFK